MLVRFLARSKFSERNILKCRYMSEKIRVKFNYIGLQWWQTHHQTCPIQGADGSM